MKKKLLSLLCVLTGTVSGFAQLKINDQFPIGHYQYSVNNFKFSFDFFENKRVSFNYEQTDKEGQNIENTSFTGNYFFDKDTIRILPDEKNEKVQLFYQKNTKIQKGKIQIRRIINERSENNDYRDYEVVSLAIGKNVKKDDFRSWDTFVAENMPAQEIDADMSLVQANYSPGDTLILRTYKSYYQENRNYYKYVLPNDANDVCIRLFEKREVFDLNLVRIAKGESDNEIRIFIDDKDMVCVYYTRPLNQDDFVKNIDTLVSLPGYTYLKADKSYVVEKEEELGFFIEKEEESELTESADYGDSYEQLSDTIEYFTSYDKALKAAQKENKFIRLYTLGTSACNTADPLNIMKNINSDDNYYNKYLLENVKKEYIICVLPSINTKIAQQYSLDPTQPARIILTQEGQLLYKETGCNSGEKSGIMFFNEDSYYANSGKFNTLIIALYNQKILAPRINNSAKTDKKILKEYLENIFQIAGMDSYMYKWEYVCQDILETKEYTEGYSDQLPDSCIREEEIGRYMDRYVNEYMNAPFDTSVAKMALLYYQYVFNYKCYPETVPASLAYLVKHMDKLNGVCSVFPSLSYTNATDLIGTVINPDNYPCKAYADQSIDNILNVLQTVQKGLPKSMPQDEYVFNLYFFIRDESTVMANPKVLDFFDKYISDVNKKMAASGEYYDLSDVLNSMAWSVYKSKNKAYMDKALAWSKKSMEMLMENYECENYYYLDTYAHLLYVTGDYENALKYQKKAFDEVSKSEDTNSVIYREIKVEYELMKLKMLDNE